MLLTVAVGRTTKPGIVADTEVVPGIAARGALPALATASIGGLAVVTLWFGLSWDGLIGWVAGALA